MTTVWSWLDNQTKTCHMCKMILGLSSLATRCLVHDTYKPDHGSESKLWMDIDFNQNQETWKMWLWNYFNVHRHLCNCCSIINTKRKTCPLPLMAQKWHKQNTLIVNWRFWVKQPKPYGRQPKYFTLYFLTTSYNGQVVTNSYNRQRFLLVQWVANI